MKIKEWIEGWEKKVPPALQEDWDNTGLQFSRPDKDLTGLVYCLDLNQPALDQAIQTGANLIFTHHPVFFNPVKQLVDQDGRSDLVLSTIEAGISVYSSHTAFDAVDGGVNDVLAEAVGVKHPNALIPRQGRDPLFAFSKGMGKIGRVRKTSLKDLAGHLKEEFSLDQVAFYGPSQAEVKEVALVGGSGMDFVDEALAQGADVFITGDIKHHQALDSLAQGIYLIDPGHYGSEFPSLYQAMTWSKALAPRLPHTIVPAPKDWQRQEV